MPSFDKFRITKTGLVTFQYMTIKGGMPLKVNTTIVKPIITVLIPTPPEPPTPPDTETYYRLLEDGSKWLLETGDHWLTEQAPPYLLLEDGGFWLLENGGFIELEGDD